MVDRPHPVPAARMYTLKQLEAFYWSATLGSFNASSNRLHTTQSAIAKRVGELESFAGMPLFERQSRRLVLTQQGHKLLVMAREMLELNQRIVQSIGDPSSLEGVVRLGVTELVGLTWLATLIDEMNRRYPNVQLMPEIDGGLTLYERLQRDELDLAFMPGPFWSYEYDSTPLGSVRNVWMASPDIDIELGRALTPHDLAPYPVISQPPNSALSHIYDVWFAEQGMSVKRVFTCNNLGVTAQLTALGMGISYLPDAYFAPVVARGVLRRLDVQPDLPPIHYYSVCKKHFMTPLLSMLVDVACEVARFDIAGGTSRRQGGTPSEASP